MDLPDDWVYQPTSQKAIADSAVKMLYRPL